MAPSERTITYLGGLLTYSTTGILLSYDVHVTVNVTVMSRDYKRQLAGHVGCLMYRHRTGRHAPYCSHYSHCSYRGQWGYLSTAPVFEVVRPHLVHHTRRGVRVRLDRALSHTIRYTGARVRIRTATNNAYLSAPNTPLYCCLSSL